MYLKSIIAITVMLFAQLAYADSAQLDNQPLIIGDANASLNMTAYFGYREPFSRRFFSDTFPAIKKAYVDTGMLSISLRPFILFSDSEKGAMLIVECVRAQSESEARNLVLNYFPAAQYITTDEEAEQIMLSLISSNAKIDSEQVILCVDREEYLYRLSENKNLMMEQFDSAGQPVFFVQGMGTSRKIGGAFKFDVFNEALDGIIRTQNEFGFKDVPLSHTHYEAISYVKQNGIVEGYSDGNFKPDALINRAEFTKIIIAALHNSPEKFGEKGAIQSCVQTPFADVAVIDWYSSYVCEAKENGVVQGYIDGTFRPAEPVIFVDAAKIIVKGLKQEISTGDYEQWYVPYIESLRSDNAIPLEIKSLNQQLTRGQMSEIIYRILANSSKPSQDYNDLH